MNVRHRIVVLDPGFQHVHAHHLNVNLGIAAAACAAGHDAVIVAAHDLAADARSACVQAGARVLARLATPGYPAQADRLPSVMHEALAEGFAAELIALLDSGFVQPDDDLHMHTGYSFHLEGLARALWRSRAPRNGRVLVSMMFHPGQRVFEEGQAPVVLDSRELSRHRRALAALAAAPLPAVDLATSCAAYQRAYRSLWPGREVLLHPSVVHRPRRGGTPWGTHGRRPRVLLYLGGPKANKGLRFSAAVGALAAPLLPELEFVFHFNDGFPGAGAFADSVAQLRAAGAMHGNVTLLEGPLADGLYADTIASCQTACLFYDPTEYAFKTSGVLWDLLEAPPLHWMVSEGTWLADELREMGLPMDAVAYGDEASALAALQGLRDHAAAAQDVPPTPAAWHYRKQLLRPYGEWLLERLAVPPPPPDTGAPAAADATPAFTACPLRILVVRTHYGHFSPLSGPGGFVPPLRAMGHRVDEWLVPLGHDSVDGGAGGERWTLLERCQAHLRSYQGNAAAFETRLQGMLDDYDVVHFVDGEHCGLLTALARLLEPGRQRPRLVATFHQPPSIMQDLLADGRYLTAFDCVHLLAPSQEPYFARFVSPERIRVVPHGLAPELLLDRLPDWITGGADPQGVERALAAVAGRRILLCVGGWLRDHAAFLATADLMRDRHDCVFVAVAKGLELDTAERPNVLVLNGGLSDEALHALYLRAELVFLPLQDAAANNAILEAMAHGLPIITTDLPSTRYYTQSQAIFVDSSAYAYACAVRNALDWENSSKARATEVSGKLREVSESLVWEKVTYSFVESLYR